MTPMITPFYGALLAGGLILLSLNVIGLRRKYKVPVGDGDNEELLRAISAHANYSQYVPITLIMIGFCELMGAHWVFIHMFCLILIIGRLIHANAVSDLQEDGRMRSHGMKITFAALGGASALAVFISVWEILRPLLIQLGTGT